MKKINYSNRKGTKQKMLIWLLAILLFAGIVWFCWFQNNGLQVTEYQLERGLEQPVKIVQLSDLHGKEFGKENQRLLETIKALSPDLIAVTGDILDAEHGNWEQISKFFGRLTQLYPVYAIHGNHEHRTGKEDKIKSLMEAQGVTYLQNQAVTAQFRQVPISILGLDENQGSHMEYRSGIDYKDFGDLFAQLEQQDGLRLVLSHYPENFSQTGDTSYQQYDFDLQLSGHAHGGQFRLPFIGPVFSPGQGFRPLFAQGLHGTHPQLIVSRGLGNSGFPLRLFNRPEIVSITIT